MQACQFSHDVYDGSDVGHVYVPVIVHISAVTGISAAKYVTLLRIEEAKELLKQYPEVTIIEVAFRTSFADNAHFTKVFHRVSGITPMQFIK